MRFLLTDGWLNVYFMRRLKIAQVAPLYESVPPKLYGGTERVVSYLTEELVAMGQEVTLFASGDSRTRARLVACAERSLRLDPQCEDSLVHHVAMLQRVVDESDAFDLIHFHIEYLHFPLSRLIQLPHVTTLHGKLTIADLKPLYRIFADMPLVSISLAQREPLPEVNWVANISHGLPVDLLRPRYRPGQYLAFLGRISPEKGVEQAVDIAVAAGLPLKIAAKVDKKDHEYYELVVRKKLTHPLVEYIGEIGEEEKEDFLGNAMALLFPIDWPEPFGLVMIEAMACGTPVVAYDRGSVSEILEHGVNGFIVKNMDEAVGAVQNIGLIERRECRRVFEARFSASRMASEYLKAYITQVETEKGLFNLQMT